MLGIRPVQKGVPYMPDFSRYIDPDKGSISAKSLGSAFEATAFDPACADMSFIDGEDYTRNDPKPFTREGMFDRGPKGLK
jgi:hypothetical protein